MRNRIEMHCGKWDAELQAQRVHRSPHIHSWVVTGTKGLKLGRGGTLLEVVGWARPGQELNFIATEHYLG